MIGRPSCLTALVLVLVLSAVCWTIIWWAVHRAT